MRGRLQNDSVRCRVSYIPAIIHKTGGVLGAGGYLSHYTRTARVYPHWDKTAVPSTRPCTRRGASLCLFFLLPCTIKIHWCSLLDLSDGNNYYDTPLTLDKACVITTTPSRVADKGQFLISPNPALSMLLVILDISRREIINNINKGPLVED